MHHLVYGINSLIHSVNLTSHVSIHLVIHLSTHLCHHPSLLHSFTPGSKPTFSTNPFHLNKLLLSFDWTELIVVIGLFLAHFLVKFSV